ncbi:hypothetical protein Hanom_Chr08g00684531 [Helianthus anomalus]
MLDLLSPTKSVDTTSSSTYPKIPLSFPSDSSLNYKEPQKLFQSNNNNDNKNIN